MLGDLDRRTLFLRIKIRCGSSSSFLSHVTIVSKIFSLFEICDCQTTKTFFVRYIRGVVNTLRYAETIHKTDWIVYLSYVLCSYASIGRCPLIPSETVVLILHKTHLGLSMIGSKACETTTLLLEGYCLCTYVISGRPEESDLMSLDDAFRSYKK